MGALFSWRRRYLWPIVGIREVMAVILMVLYLARILARILLVLDGYLTGIGLVGRYWILHRAKL